MSVLKFYYVWRLRRATAALREAAEFLPTVDEVQNIEEYAEDFREYNDALKEVIYYLRKVNK